MKATDKRGRWVMIATFILLGLSLWGNVVQATWPEKEYSIVGTFTEKSEVLPPDRYYYAFVSDGTFQFYQNGVVLGSGNYSLLDEAEGIYAIEDFHRIDGDYLLMFRDGKLYRLGNGSYVVYEKIIDSPQLLGDDAPRYVE
ncbi:MAG: hypothetical protein LBM18_05440 [Oscillospiraceae bacterium]|jgi:hypothetical protein|nr:hypothetical protein [Oscillospiraceae bacterium]